jgi:two-component system NtrC family response regulator
MVDGHLVSARDLDIYAGDSEDAFPLNLRQVRDEAERKAVTRALARADHNLAQASRLLGISRPTLYNLLEKFQIDHHDD